MFVKSYQVRSNEIDLHYQLSYPSIIRLMQETSMQHIIELKASFWDLKEQNKTWVLLKKEIHFWDSAELNDIVEVQTYPSGFSKIFAYRDYHMHHHNGEKIASASSVWALIDIDIRKPLSVQDHPLKKHVPSGIDFLPHPKLSPVISDNIDHSTIYKVKYYDLDWNGHANNTYLTHLILTSLNRQWHLDHSMTRMSIQFKSECFYDDKLSCTHSMLSDNMIQHQLVRCSDQKLICLCETEWNKKRA